MEIHQIRLLTVKEVASRCGLSRGRVYELIRENALPAVRFGERQVRVSEAALLRFIEAGGTPSFSEEVR
jgi:excisionase family DNA binding protein